MKGAARMHPGVPGFAHNAGKSNSSPLLISVMKNRAGMTARTPQNGAVRPLDMVMPESKKSYGDLGSLAREDFKSPNFEEADNIFASAKLCA